MATSSNDLILEQLRELLAERQAQREEGLTIRALSKRLERHSDDDEKRHDALEGRLRELERQAAHAEGEISTGRFQLPPVPIIVGPKSKRPSTSGFFGVFADPKKFAALVGLLTLLAHAALRLLRP